jgi:type IV pilus assembly protein PilB
MLAKIGLPPETKSLYRPPSQRDKPPEEAEGEPVEVCEVCGGSGYLGRSAIFELAEMTEELRKLVTAGAGVQELKVQARKDKMMTFQQEGLKLVVAGKTSLEELQRIFQPKK